MPPYSESDNERRFARTSNRAIEVMGFIVLFTFIIEVLCGIFYPSLVGSAITVIFGIFGIAIASLIKSVFINPLLFAGLWLGIGKNSLWWRIGISWFLPLCLGLSYQFNKEFRELSGLFFVLFCYQGMIALGFCLWQLWGWRLIRVSPDPSLLEQSIQHQMLAPRYQFRLQDLFRVMVVIALALTIIKLNVNLSNESEWQHFANNLTSTRVFLPYYFAITLVLIVTLQVYWVLQIKRPRASWLAALLGTVIFAHLLVILMLFGIFSTLDLIYFGSIQCIFCWFALCIYCRLLWKLRESGFRWIRLQRVSNDDTPQVTLPAVIENPLE